MKIKLRAVEKTSPANEKHRVEKARMASCSNEEERKAMIKAGRFNKKVSGGAVR